MQNLKRFTALLLCFLMLASVSCGQTDSSADTTASEIAAEQNTETAAPETEAVPALEARDFEGRTFSIMGERWSTYTPLDYVDVVVESQTGEALNDAAFNRNINMEEQYNCKVAFRQMDGGQSLGALQSEVLSGDGAYDVTLLRGTYSATAVTSGYLADMGELPHMDTSRPWWYRDAFDALEVGGKNYVGMGYITTNHMNAVWTVCFNKQMIVDNKMDDPYTLVSEGKWTFDAMNTYMEGIALDLNGDGNMTPEDDRYAFIVEGTFGNALYMAAGLTAVSCDSEGNWTMNIGSEASVNLVDKCAAIFNDPSKIHTDVNASNPTLYSAIFSEGRGLFTSAAISHTTSYRDMEDDFGVLPVPVLEEGDPYLTACNTWLPSGIAIPLTCQDKEKIGLITETMAAYSHEYLLPAIVEKTLGKIARDSTSYQIMMMLYDNAAFDFNTIMNFSDTSNMLRAAVIGATENFASAYKSIQKPAEKMLSRFIEDCRNLAQEQ